VTMRLLIAAMLLAYVSFAGATIEGTFWDPRFNGEGWTIESQNDLAFLSLRGQDQVPGWSGEDVLDRTWHLAPGTWHLAPGTGIWQSAPGFLTD
ncbi:MAG: hypothetical protein AAF358_26535, partial [Pseudomonadota bacterium]